MVPMAAYECPGPGARATETAELLLDAEAMAAVDALVEAVGLLEREPEAGHLLQGRPGGQRSLRVGAYRIICPVDDDQSLVGVLGVGHRSVAYTTDPCRGSVSEQGPDGLGQLGQVRIRAKTAHKLDVHEPRHQLGQDLREGEHGNVVVGEAVVDGDESEVFGGGLGDQHAVEGIGVVEWQTGSVERV